MSRPSKLNGSSSGGKSTLPSARKAASRETPIDGGGDRRSQPPAAG
eukprot:CAMPEP_0202108328 /NCGR_PEP_ID=MMETSP0965-20130614/20373_1 /ASSEMBLY_ACC=CAM_ASM_000507 /TAXON_ID=4773 /ORGANISM="Schizochytrium aggregatum, Strain ATCC28209" /LENGTH=45 /DNA_ID= /DNA_START= /DNA_END= /DNA_ORIENTATION=